MNASAPIRFNGTLKKWNVDRGFGFVLAEHGDQDVFVHVSAFPRDGRQPVVGEPLSFEVGLDKDGRKRAMHVQRPGEPSPLSVRPKGGHAEARRKRTNRSDRTPSSPVFGRLLFVLLAIGVGGFALDHYRSHTAAISRLSAATQGVMPPPAETTLLPSSHEPEFRCDGRLHCSQMTSCGEAKFFLRNCPGVKMDGDRNGIPCEKQWCNP